jgi:hypothetical protein
MGVRRTSSIPQAYDLRERRPVTETPREPCSLGFFIGATQLFTTGCVELFGFSPLVDE